MRCQKKLLYRVNVRIHCLSVKHGINYAQSICVWIICISIILACVLSAEAAFESFSQTADDLWENMDLIHLCADSYNCTFSREWRYGLSELAVNKLEFNLRKDRHLGCLRWFSSGDELYSENRFSLGGCMNAGGFSISISANYNYLLIKSYGHYSNLGLDVFTALECFDNLHCAIGLDGLISGDLDRQLDAADRTIYGLLLYNNSKLEIISVIMKAKWGSLSKSLGIRYQLFSWFSCRILATDYPERLTMGVSANIRNISFSVITCNQPALGWTQKTSVGFKW